jgi:hypothetical protein
MMFGLLTTILGAQGFQGVDAGPLLTQMNGFVSATIPLSQRIRCARIRVECTRFNSRLSCVNFLSAV